jgi:hypothetical protein
MRKTPLFRARFSIPKNRCRSEERKKPRPSGRGLVPSSDFSLFLYTTIMNSVGRRNTEAYETV